MAEPTLDSFGNFRTAPGPQPPVSTPTTNALGNLTGSGSPEGVVTASPGRGYVDMDTGDFWVKQTGTGDTGWNQITGSGGSGGGLTGSGTPEGAVTADPGQTYWDALNRKLYVKDTGTGNTGWQELVGL